MPILTHGEAEAEQQVLAALRLAVILSGVVLVIEAVGATFSRSLSLTVDAVHNVPDLAAFAISWAALQGARSGASAEFTFGTHRLEVFAGLLNGLIVLGAGLVFGYEAVVSVAFHSSFAGPVDPLWIVAAAIPTLALRSVSLRVLGRLPGPVRDLNLRSVIVHLASDLAIAGTLVLAGVGLLVRPDLGWLDPGAALVIAAILVYEAVPLLREGAEVLTERTPRGLTVDAIARSARSVPDVVEVHDVHVWSVCSTLVCLTAHVEVAEMSVSESMAVVRALRERMERDFGIVHATFEIEVSGAPREPRGPSGPSPLPST